MEEEQLNFFARQQLSGDHRIIRQAYNEVVVRLARLAPYGATGEIDELVSDVGNRQTEFAIDDLIHLAIAGRRLVNSVSAAKDAGNIRLPEIRLFSDRGHIGGYRMVSMMKVTRVLNKLVHSVSINIVGHDFTGIGLTQEEAIASILRSRPSKLLPVCVVTDEDNRTVGFHIGALCYAMSQVLALAAERAIEHDLYLEDFFNT